MLEVNLDTVFRLIDLAREFHADQEVTLEDEPESFDEDWETHELAEYSGNPVLEEFRGEVDGLNPDEQQQVVALMWVGRGDYDIEEWDEALEYAAEAWTPDTADYLIAHPLLADHLANGLEVLGLSGAEAD